MAPLKPDRLLHPAIPLILTLLLWCSSPSQVQGLNIRSQPLTWFSSIKLKPDSTSFGPSPAL